MKLIFTALVLLCISTAAASAADSDWQIDSPDEIASHAMQLLVREYENKGETVSSIPQSAGGAISARKIVGWTTMLLGFSVIGFVTYRRKAVGAS